MAENIEEIKAHLKKAVELESFLFTYGKVKEEMNVKLGLVSREAYEVQEYKLGEKIPSKYSDICKPISQPPSDHPFQWRPIYVDDYKKMGRRYTRYYTFEDYKSGDHAPPKGWDKYRSVKKDKELPESPLLDAVASFIAGIIVGLLLVAVISAIRGIIYGLGNDPFYHIRIYFVQTWYFGLIGGVIFVILDKMGMIKPSDSTVSKEFLEEVEKYESIVRERNEKLAAEHRTIKYCNDTLASIPPMEAAVAAKLKEHYSAGLIYPKYQNFVAVAQIYEYLDSGRCDSLAGPNGAYNLFEQEMRANIIIVQLDRIYNKLEEIRQMQVMIYNTLCSVQRLLGGIQSELSNLTDAVYDNTAAINRFNAQVNSYLY